MIIPKYKSQQTIPLLKVLQGLPIPQKETKDPQKASHDLNPSGSLGPQPLSIFFVLMELSQWFKNSCFKPTV